MSFEIETDIDTNEFLKTKYEIDDKDKIEKGRHSELNHALANQEVKLIILNHSVCSPNDPTGLLYHPSGPNHDVRFYFSKHSSRYKCKSLYLKILKPNDAVGGKSSESDMINVLN
nr:1195_t:CDS:2 [Entrophospora candida]